MNDLRFAMRMFGQRPGVAALIVVTLGIGIAASTVVFSVADAILWHPLPFRDARRLVSLTSYDPAKKVTSRSVPLSALNAWRAKDSILEDIYTYGQDSFLLTGDGDAEELTGGVVSQGLFAALGVHPRLGRDLAVDDYRDDSEAVVVLSDTLWRRRFAAAGDILGRPLTMNDRRYTIVGVMGPGFTFPVDSDRLWIPLVANPAGLTRGNVLARLRPGVSLTHAQAVTAATTRNLVDQGVQALPEIRIGPFTRRDPETINALWVLLGAVGFLLLIAVSNAANVLLAEAVRRDAEMAVRSSLGASFGRLVRQVVTETLLVTGVAAVAATALAAAALRVAVAGMPWILTYQSLRPIALDWRAMVFTVGIATAAGLATALAPLTRARRAGSQSTLKGHAISATSHGRLRAALVVLQLAVTVVLLVAAGLLANSFVRLNRVNLGFSTTTLLRVSIGLPETQFRDKSAVDRFLDEWRRAAGRVPGVVSATISEAIPPGLIESPSATIETADRGLTEQHRIAWGDIDEGYFATLGIPLLQGRAFDARDRHDSPLAAVISVALAQQLWPGSDPIGRHFRFAPTLPWHAVIGVAGNVKNGDREVNQSFGNERAVYFARTQTTLTQRWESLIVRAAGDPKSLEHPLRELTRALNPNTPIISVETADEIVAEISGRARFVTMLMWGLAAIATLLALVGVYGAFWYAVRQRTREIGVRLALGAEPLDIVRLVLTENARVIAAGLMIGLPIALAVSRGLRSMLFDVSPADPPTLIVVSTALLAAALTASYLPARRVSRIDPTEALRHE